MSEQEPLLFSQSRSQDPEANVDEIANERSDERGSWREKTAEFLESPPLHYTVIGLVRVVARVAARC